MRRCSDHPNAGSPNTGLTRCPAAGHGAGGGGFSGGTNGSLSKYHFFGEQNNIFKQKTSLVIFFINRRVSLLVLPVPVPVPTVPIKQLWKLEREVKDLFREQIQYNTTRSSDEI